MVNTPLHGHCVCMCVCDVEARHGCRGWGGNSPDRRGWFLDARRERLAVGRRLWRNPLSHVELCGCCPATEPWECPGIDPWDPGTDPWECPGVPQPLSACLVRAARTGSGPDRRRGAHQARTAGPGERL